MLPNYLRMFDLIDQVFETKHDPDQLQVDEGVIQKLQEIHPATLGELANENGPLIWVLMIPTTAESMTLFLEAKISERELVDRTKPGDTYTSIYLCSVTTLPEMRRKGETKSLCMRQIEAIQKSHPITSLFVWPFTPAGAQLAEKLGKASGLPVMSRVR